MFDLQVGFAIQISTKQVEIFLLQVALQSFPFAANQTSSDCIIRDSMCLSAR